MNKEVLLKNLGCRIKAAGDKDPEPCVAYEAGFCEEMQKPCDMCYTSSIKVFTESN
jgi:hypothetical protein